MLRLVSCPALLLLLLLAGCKSNDSMPSHKVDAHNVHQTYKIQYNAAKQQETIQAMLHSGGQEGIPIYLTGAAQLICNGQPLREQENLLMGTYYTHKDDRFSEKYLLQLTLNDQTRYDNAVRLKRVALPELPDTVFAAEGLRINWEGPPLSSTEAVQISLKDTAGHFISKSVKHQAARAFALSAQNLQMLEPGPIRVQLERLVRNTPLRDVGDHGGRFVGSYKSPLGTFWLRSQRPKPTVSRYVEH
jgi:hypothetical protein